MVNANQRIQEISKEQDLLVNQIQILRQQRSELEGGTFAAKRKDRQIAETQSTLDKLTREKKLAEQLSSEVKEAESKGLTVSTEEQERVLEKRSSTIESQVKQKKVIELGRKAKKPQQEAQTFTETLEVRKLPTKNIVSTQDFTPKPTFSQRVGGFFQRVKETSPFNPKYYMKDQAYTLTTDAGTTTSITVKAPTATSYFAGALPIAAAVTPAGIVRGLPSISKAEFIATVERQGEGSIVRAFSETTAKGAKPVTNLGEQIVVSSGSKAGGAGYGYTISYPKTILTTTGKLKTTQQITPYLTKAKITQLGDASFTVSKGTLKFTETGLGKGTLVSSQTLRGGETLSDVSLFVTKKVGSNTYNMFGGDAYLRIGKKGGFKYILKDTTIKGKVFTVATDTKAADSFGKIISSSSKSSLASLTKAEQKTAAGLVSSLSKAGEASIVIPKQFITQTPKTFIGSTSFQASNYITRLGLKQSPSIKTVQVMQAPSTLIKKETRSITIPKLKTPTKTTNKLIGKTITTPLATSTPRITQTPIEIQTPILKTPTRTTTRITPKTTTSITPIVPPITPPITTIPKVPLIPLFKLPFPVDRGTGQGNVLGSFGTRYTPSFTALLKNIRGKKPKKKKFTGLEIRPITKDFRWWNNK